MCATPCPHLDLAQLRGQAERGVGVRAVRLDRGEHERLGVAAEYVAQWGCWNGALWSCRALWASACVGGKWTVDAHLAGRAFWPDQIAATCWSAVATAPPQSANWNLGKTPVADRRKNPDEIGTRQEVPILAL
eukprot:343286-Chlamydomonas_euryale.AAC.3